MAGELLSLGIPNLKLLFDDEDGSAIVHILDDKFVIHSEFKKGVNLDKAMEVSNMIDEAFKERGINSLYTWTSSRQEEVYSGYLGYKPTGVKVLTHEEGGPLPDDYPYEVYEFKKDLI